MFFKKKRNLQQRIESNLKNLNKENFKSKEYRMGFEDCLNIICRIFNLKK